MRLIDADAFDRDLCNHRFTAALNEAADAGTAFEDREMYYSTQSFRDVMKYRPTIEAVPVVHGRWIGYPECLQYVNAYSDDHIVCSACEQCFSILDNCTEEFDYCPHCGARMNLEETDV